MAPVPYRLEVMGRYSINNTIIACPDCRTDRGLIFTTDSATTTVTATCPTGHRWEDPRVSSRAIRDAVAAVQRSAGL